MDRVVVQPIGKDKFRVYKDFSYLGVCVPKGYVTNGADIPRIFWSIFPPNSPEYMSAIVIHDYLCDQYPEVSYKEADKKFYEAMIEIGVSKWKAKTFYFYCNFFHQIKEVIKGDK